jgi:hypothetical protein
VSYEPRRNWGCIISAALFAVAGVPLLGLMSLGERECDVVKSNPCEISWGWMQLIYAVAVVAICVALGWFVTWVFRRDEDNG